MKTQKLFWIIVMGVTIFLYGCSDNYNELKHSDFDINVTLEYNEALDSYCSDIPDIQGEFIDCLIEEAGIPCQYLWNGFRNGVMCMDELLNEDVEIVFVDGKNITIGKIRVIGE